MPVEMKSEVVVNKRTKRKKLKMVRAESNEDLVARIVKFNTARYGAPRIALRIAFSVYDPEAADGKGNHAGLRGEALSLDETSYKEIMADIAKIRALF